ncbi:oxidoreductase [Mangrovibacter sp. MFB070]|uniref:Gfo/Idh/MocA family protein n=1 Tax=Mangrovibacter sp. MFB070 TaxID=1224318 RepID=UPI0004D4947D|nr:Gfo/Idh/MocA family oxidoreductase [Mangrovibacter sp. MFB070]KEA53847.1 oxidoreductase [Mangrovibacter sp. MFB070]
MSGLVNWGILGYARIARNSLIPAISRAANAHLYGVASRNSAQLPDGEWDKSYPDYASLLADEAIDAVYIPLPNSLHKTWVIRALEAGKHVLCEKPLGLTAEEGNAMHKAAQQHGLILMEAFMYRYTHRMQAVKSVLESGVLGDIRHINATFRFLLNRPGTIKMQPALGGGALYDVGCYPVNFVGMVTQRVPVRCEVLCEMDNGVDTQLSALLQYGDGLIANIHCGFNSFGSNFAEIIGTKGLLRIDDTFQDNAGDIWLHTDEGSRAIPVEESDRYLAEVSQFSAAVLKQPAHCLSLEESIRNLQVLDMIRTKLPTAGN